MDIEIPLGVLAVATPRKLNSYACQEILKLMGDITNIDGHYTYDNRGNMTFLYIDPVDRRYIDDESEYKTAVTFFSKVLFRIIDHYGDQVWE